MNQSFWGTVIVMIILVVLTIGMNYYMSYKKFKQQREYYKELQQRLKIGQQVEFGNGLYGKVKKIEEETCDIEIKSGAIMTVSRYTIGRIVNE